MNAKVKSIPAAPVPEPKKLDEETKELIRSAASQMFKMVWRAEGKAQATLVMKDMVPKLEAVLAKDRAESNKKIGLLAEMVNKQSIMISVMQDLLCDDSPLIVEDGRALSAEERRVKFGQLCSVKQAILEGSATA